MSSITLYIPADTAAVAMGVEELIIPIRQQAQDQNIELQIVRNGTRGLLWLEPLLEVQTPEGRIAYGPVSAEDLDSLFAADWLHGGAHTLCQGLTDEIPYLKKQERLTFARTGITDPLSLTDYSIHGGWAGLRKALNMNPENIVKQVINSGLRGRGGAAFPTGIKWNTVRQAQSVQKYIVCNADEGDSGTFSDRILMEGDPFCLIEGMIIAGLAVGATHGYIYVRSEYPLAFDILSKAITIAYDNHYLGRNILSSGKNFELEVRKGAGAYICGEETSLLNSLEGKRGTVRFKPPLPALHGFMNKPTVVNNVITLASVPTILNKGAEFYQNYGMGRSRGTLAFQLTGNVKRGGLIEKAFGVSLNELIYDFGDGSASGATLKTAQVGGPLGSYLSTDEWDTPLDYEAYAKIEAMVGHGGIVIFDENTSMAHMAEHAMEFCAIESCGKCTPCRIGSTRGVEIIQKIRRNIDYDENLNLLHELCDTMLAGSLCALGGMAPIPVLSALKKYPEDFKINPTDPIGTELC
ncbi:formate dehydrogenase [Oligella urethralis]|uniref:formate dehydrogenase beta subunit n=1 Tax=Oligella urethralis TaxID=90245 RepID=UPI000CFE8FBA|nr:formate dehydrogenase beta subunit [Oligella urethralis]AVL71404.1 formate dehydrogenase [Oligella urethralis]